MTQKRNLIYMLFIFTTLCCLTGCDRFAGSRTTTPTPSVVPFISSPATATPTMPPVDQTGPTGIPTSPENSKAPTAIPTATATPSPTATPTPTPSPTPVPMVPPAPVAVNTDTTTIDFIINRDYPLTSSYLPNDLVIPDIPFSFSDVTLDKRKLKKVAADAMEDLCAAALAEEGLTIYGVSGYRSYDRQYEIYGSKLINQGIRYTNLYSAAPGNSEHQTGLAIDVSCKSVGFGLVERFAETSEGMWIKDNGWRFGFILRYPKEKEHITGYAYEPWHIRYVGVPLAYYLYTNNLTLEEYYGSPSSHTLADLADRPLIDMHTDRFYLLYAATLGSELYYKEDGSILLSDATGLPHLKELVRDANGRILLVNGNRLFLEPALDANGNHVLNAAGNVLCTKPYFDIEGNLWLDYSGSPIYLQPLWNADGTPATDAAGNILYTEPETDLSGLEIITGTGSLIPKVPMRDDTGELLFDDYGNVCFYQPFVNPATGQYIIDTSTGLPLYPSRYYEVPHNTLPLPAELLTGNTPDPWTDETDFPESEESDYYTTDETGGFFE